MADFTPIPGPLGGRKSTYKTTVAGVSVEIIKAPTTPCTITVIPGANTGLVQITTSPESEIDADTAVKQNWPAGNVTSVTNDVLAGPVSALYLIATGGEVVFEVTA